MKQSFLIYKIVLEDPTVNSLLNKFYSLLLQNINNHEKVTLPQHYFSGFIKYQTFIGNIIENYYHIYGQSNFRLYFQTLMSMLGEKFKNSNPNVKAEFMDFLFTLNIMEKGRIVSEVLNILDQ